MRHVTGDLEGFVDLVEKRFRGEAKRRDGNIVGLGRNR
jgi:hypothetical protein